MLESWGEALNRARYLRVDGITLAARRRGMVRFVEDEESAGTEIAEPIAQRSGIGLVDQEPVGNKEPGMRGPRVHAEAPFATNPGDKVFVEDLEQESETLF